MRVNLFHRFAALVGIGVASIGYADFGQNATGSYVPPSKWSSFNAPGSTPGTPAQIATPQNSYSEGLTAVKPLAPQPRYVQSTPIDSFGAQPLFPEAAAVLPVSGYASSGLQRSVATPQPIGGSIQRTSTGHMPVGSQFEDGFSTAALAPHDAHPQAQHHPQPQPYPAETHSPYEQAMSAPWPNCDPCPNTVACAPSRLPLSPWFGGANVLFWNMEDNGYHRFLVDDAIPSTITIASSESVSPSSAVGYETFIGRYFDCGRYGLSVSYLNFNPGQEELTAQDLTPGGDYRAAMPQYSSLMIDPDGAGVDPAVDVYDHYDSATAFRIRRDVDIQGLEVNLSCFGIMGARRLAPLCGSGFGYGPISRLKQSLGLGGNGYTGAGGALESPCAGCSQVVMSHGFRWLQFSDEFQFAASQAQDGWTGGTDIFHDIDAENNLYGYQFGGRLTYCLTPRLVANIGGKAGIYGNDVDVQQRIGTFANDAYVDGDLTQVINTRSSDVVLSGLGEVDLGLGYRLNNCWTINGGYRALYATGVATSIGSIANDYASINSMPKVYADDSLMLHGAYIGASMNW